MYEEHRHVRSAERSTGPEIGLKIIRESYEHFFLFISLKFEYGRMSSFWHEATTEQRHPAPEATVYVGVAAFCLGGGCGFLNTPASSLAEPSSLIAEALLWR